MSAFPGLTNISAATPGVPGLPIQVQQAQFSEISNALAAFLGAATSTVQAGTASIERQTAEGRREQQLELAAAQVEISKSRVVASKERILTMKQRIHNVELQQEYENAVETERLGVIKIITDVDTEPELKTAFLNKYKFLDPANRRLVLGAHGNTLATIDTLATEAAIMEWFNRPENQGKNPPREFITQLMNEALKQRGDLPPEMALAYQRTFIAAARHMINMRAIRHADETQRRAERAVKDDFAGAAASFWLGKIDISSEMRSAAPGSIEEDSVERALAAKIKLVEGDADVEETQRMLAQELQASGLQSLGNVPLEMTEQLWADLGDELKKRMPLMEGRIQRARRKADSDEQAGLMTAFRKRLTDYKEDGVVELVEDHRNRIPGLEKLTDDQKKALFFDANRAIEEINNKNALSEQLRKRGATDEIANTGPLIHNAAGKTYGLTDVWRQLRGVEEVDPRRVAKLVAGQPWSRIAEIIARAPNDEEAKEAVELFDDPIARTFLADSVEAALKRYGGSKFDQSFDKSKAFWPMIGRGGADRFGIDMKEGWTDQFVMGYVRRASNRNLPEASADDLTNEAQIQATDWSQRNFVGYRRVAVGQDLLGIGTFANPLPSEWLDDMYDNFESFHDGDPSLLGAFRRAGKTYIPSIMNGETTAYLEIDPHNQTAGRTITSTTGGAEFRELLVAGMGIGPPGGDLGYHTGLPDNTVRGVDAALYDDDEKATYAASIHAKFAPIYAQTTGLPTDFSVEPTDPVERARWELLGRKYNNALDNYARQTLGFASFFIPPPEPK